MALERDNPCSGAVLCFEQDSKLKSVAFDQRNAVGLGALDHFFERIELLGVGVVVGDVPPYGVCDGFTVIRLEMLGGPCDGRCFYLPVFAPVISDFVLEIRCIGGQVVVDETFACEVL